MCTEGSNEPQEASSCQPQACQPQAATNAVSATGDRNRNLSKSRGTPRQRIWPTGGSSGAPHMRQRGEGHCGSTAGRHWKKEPVAGLGTRGSWHDWHQGTRGSSSESDSGSPPVAGDIIKVLLAVLCRIRSGAFQHPM